MERLLMPELPTETTKRTEESLNLWVNVGKCARCGSDHVQLMFTRFEGELPLPNTHWATCPQTGQPVLLEVENTDEGAALVKGADVD